MINKQLHFEYLIIKIIKTIVKNQIELCAFCIIIFEV